MKQEYGAIGPGAISDTNRIEPVCLFCALQSIPGKASPVSTQSFASLVYKIKHIEDEGYHRIPKHRSGFGAKMSEESAWVSSQFITTAQTGCCYDIKGK